jgi:hypothetical protein
MRNPKRIKKYEKAYPFEPSAIVEEKIKFLLWHFVPLCGNKYAFTYLFIYRTFGEIFSNLE